MWVGDGSHMMLGRELELGRSQAASHLQPLGGPLLFLNPCYPEHPALLALAQWNWFTACTLSCVFSLWG